MSLGTATRIEITRHLDLPEFSVGQVAGCPIWFYPLLSVLRPFNARCSQLRAYVIRIEMNIITGVLRVGAPFSTIRNMEREAVVHID